MTRFYAKDDPEFLNIRRRLSEISRNRTGVTYVDVDGSVVQTVSELPHAIPPKTAKEQSVAYLKTAIPAACAFLSGILLSLLV